MNHTVTLHTYDGLTTVIPFDNTITIATLLLRYREQTGYGGCIELFDMDHPTEQPFDHTMIVQSNKTLFVQKSVFEAIPDKVMLQRLVNLYCDGVFTDEERKCYGPIEYWNVHLITNMSGLFCHKRHFNQSLDHWDVSNVTNMTFMFCDAKAFNQPLNNWDVSNVTTMQYMFRGAFAFNQPLNNWNVSKVTNMRFMFDNAHMFNQPLQDWDVSKVIWMRYMFRSAKMFNQPLNNWNVRNATEMGNG